MRIKNRALNMLYIAVFLLISGYGLALALGINEGQFLILPLSYSNLSNIIPFTYFFICLIHGVFVLLTKNGSKEIIVFPRFKGAVTMCPTLTLLIFHFLLFRGSFYIPGTNNLDWRNLIIHYITPALVILHWLLFDKKSAFKRIDSIVWMVIPIGYMIFSFVYAEVGTVFFRNGARYPYYFINPDQIGWPGVVVSVIGIFIFFVLLGLFFCFIDKQMAKLGKEKN